MKCRICGREYGGEYSKKGLCAVCTRKELEGERPLTLFDFLNESGKKKLNGGG